MSTIGQIVRQVIEQLSDGVSQLVLMVVILQEQNADVPPGLTPAASTVINAAEMMGNVAKQLAAKNYANYPDIAKEIVDSAAAVETASKSLTKALQDLSGLDKKTGWAGLVDACRVMSGKTIKLLQIVYGAELKRLYATADDFLKLLDNFNTAGVSTDPQSFADSASALAQQAQLLNSYLAQRIKDEESPLVKEELLKRYNDTNDAINSLIDAVNALLQDPDNEDKRKAVEDWAKRLHDLTTGALKVINDNRTDMGSMSEQDLPSLSKALADRDNTRKVQEKNEFDKFISESAPPPPVAGFRSFDHWDDFVNEPANNSELDAKIREVKSLIDNLNDALASGDPAAIAAATRRLADAMRELEALADLEMKKINDPLRQANILNTIKNLQKNMPKYMEASAAVIKNPGDPLALNAAKKIASDLTDLLAELHEETRQPNIEENAARLESLLKQLSDAVNRGDKDEVDRLLKEIAAVKALLDHQAKYQTQYVIDPVRQKELADSIKSLGNIFDQLKLAAVNLDKVKYNDEEKKFKEALERLKDAANAEAANIVERLLEDTTKVSYAASRDDPKALQENAESLAKHAKILGKKVHEAIARSSPQEQAKLAHHLKLVENAVADQLRSIKKVLDNPKDEEAKAQLQKDNDTLRVVLKDAHDAIKGHGDISGGVDYISLNAVQDDLKHKLKELDEVVMKLKLGDKSGVHDFDKLLEGLKQDERIIESAVSFDPSDRLLGDATCVKVDSDELLNTITKDYESVTKAAKFLDMSIKDLVKDLEHAKEGADAEQQKCIDVAIRLLQTQFEKALQAVKEAQADKNDLQKQAVAASAITALKETANAAVDLVRNKAHDEKEMLQATTDIKEALSRLNKSAEKGDKKGTEQALVDMNKAEKKYTRAANKRVNFLPKETKDDMEELRRLWNKIGHPARELAAKGGKDAESEKELKADTKQIVTLLDKVNEDSNVSKIAQFQKTSEALNKVAMDLRSEDQSDVAADVRELVKQANACVAIAQTESNPEKQAQLIECVNELNATIKKTIQTAGKVMSEPESHAAKEEFNAALNQSQAQISKAISVLSDCQDRQVGVEKAIYEAKSANANLREALVSQNDSSIQQALGETLTKTTQAVDKAKKLASIHHDKDLGKVILDTATKTENALKNLKGDPKTMAEKTVKLESELNELLSTVNQDAKDNLAKDNALGKNFAAKLKHEIANGANLNEISKLADKLPDHLKNLVQDIVVVAKDHKIDNKPTPDLDALLAKIQENKYTASEEVQVNDMLAEMDKLAAAAAEAKKPKVVEVVEEPKTFEDVLDKVAKDIQVAADAAASENETSLGIADELRRLANAARAGQRQEMIKAGRAVATLILNMVNEINDTVKRMGNKNPIQADKLIRAAQALRNFSTQLKILTSVKAASIEQDTDNDGAIISITKSLGNVLGEAIGSLDVVRTTILKEKLKK